MKPTPYRAPTPSALPPLALLALLAPMLGGCPGPATPAAPPVLDPEPAGAPTDPADGRFVCLGDNAPRPATPGDLLLAGYVRTLADPTNASGAQPEAEVEAFDASGSLGSSMSATMDGRVVLTVPTDEAGFAGHVRVTAPGLVPTSLYSSRAYTGSVVNGWVWLPTPEEADAQAASVGETLAAGQGTLVGTVHDCDVFGVANAVIRYAGRTDGVVYYEGFAPDTSLSYTGASGRFAVANVPPGEVTVEAFGRLEPGGPLTLLSRAEVTVTADEVTSVDLEPRVGVER